MDTTQPSARKAARRKGDRGVVMEGPLAAWYAGNTGAVLTDFMADASRVAARLQPGARVLEIAPGPGYLAIALASTGPYEITGIDISRSFVSLAEANADRATSTHPGARLAFVHGDASDMPFADKAFDFVVCRAAFKNFADPLGALCEIRRVLAPGGEALIIDMRRDASDAAIRDSVEDMNLPRVNAWATGLILRFVLRGRAYLASEFERMAAQARFAACDVDAHPLALDVWLRT